MFVIARKRQLLLTFTVIAAVLMPASALAAQKVLRIHLDGPVMEQPPGEMNVFAALMGDKVTTFRGLLDTLDKAAEADDIAGIALIVESPQMSFAQADEFIRKMHAFQKTGKKIHCYLDYAGNLSYMFAANADDITIAEHSELGIVGLNAELTFYKGLLDKVGVYPDMLHCGAYKSAVEPYTRTEPSMEAAENINWLLDGVFERWLQLMADGRGLSVADIHSAVDSAPVPAEKAKELKLVDEVSSFTEFKQRIYKDYGKDVEIIKKIEDEDAIKLDFDNPFALFGAIREIMEKSSEPRKPGIALIYVDGPIVMGKNEPSLFGGSSSVGSTTIRAAFEEARTDENIKAVVLRVNSPGGSALASDIMWKAETRCAKEKPLIVSQGGVAGSGGYYVSIPGDVIFAEDATITGSIGVLGGKLVWQELMEDKLGVTTASFSRGKHAGIWTMNERWNDNERAFVQDYMDRVYGQFKDRVRASRGERLKKELDDIAGGRVFTGRQALDIGLVDRIGGLEDALQYAAQKAGLGDDYDIYTLPKPMEFADIIKELLGEENKDEWEISLGITQPGNDLLRSALPLIEQLSPDLAADMIRDLQNILTLNRERVGCYMPTVPRIR